MITMTMSKVKSRSHHDIAHLQPLSNVSTNYQLPALYGFIDIAQTKILKVKSLWQDQRSNQGNTMTFYTYNPQPIYYQVSTSYTL